MEQTQEQPTEECNHTMDDAADLDTTQNNDHEASTSHVQHTESNDSFFASTIDHIFCFSPLSVLWIEWP